MKSISVQAPVLGAQGSRAKESKHGGLNFRFGLGKVDQELWPVLSFFIIAGLFSPLVESHRLISSWHTLPTIFPGYADGRRHAGLAAGASMLIVIILARHAQKGVALLEPVGGSLCRVFPILLAQNDKHDRSGYGPSKGNEIPIEARVLAVADAHDTLISHRPYRRAITSFEAQPIIVSGAGSSFDPGLVGAFIGGLEPGQMDIPENCSI